MLKRARPAWWGSYALNVSNWIVYVPSAAFRGSSRLWVLRPPQAPDRLPIFRVRFDLPFLTCAQSVFPVVKPLALTSIRRPGAPSSGDRSTRTALTVIWVEALRVGTASSVA